MAATENAERNKTSIETADGKNNSVAPSNGGDGVIRLTAEGREVLEKSRQEDDDKITPEVSV